MADASGHMIFRKQLRCGQVLNFLPRSGLHSAMEVCATSHYWGREIAKLGHEVRLIAKLRQAA